MRTAGSRLRSLALLLLLVGRPAGAVDVTDVLARMRRAAEPGRDMRAAVYKIRTLDRIETIAGYPTPTQITMAVVPAHTSTRFSLREVEYDTGLTEQLFEGP